MRFGEADFGRIVVKYFEKKRTSASQYCGRPPPHHTVLIFFAYGVPRAICKNLRSVKHNMLLVCGDVMVQIEGQSES